MLGTWTPETNGGDGIWTFAREGRAAYRVTFKGENEQKGTDENEQEGFVARLVVVGNTQFLDLYPTETDRAGQFPVHFVVQIRKAGSGLSVAALSSEWLTAYLRKHPAAIRHELVPTGAILTASPREIQRFLSSHVNTQGAFYKPLLFTRRNS